MTTVSTAATAAELIADYQAAGSTLFASPRGTLLGEGTYFAVPPSGRRDGLADLARRVDAVLGVALGLLASAFARSEFQAVQFMPVIVLPQFFLCGLLVPREQLPGWLQAVSDVLPLTYAVEALQELGGSTTATGTMWIDVGVVAGAALLALGLAAATLRRRTS